MVIVCDAQGRDDVAVGIQRQGDGAVSEHVLDDLRVDAAGQQ